MTTLLCSDQLDGFECICADDDLRFDSDGVAKICVHLGGLPVQESISIMAYEFNQPQQNFGLQTETETRPSGRNLPLMDPNRLDKGKRPILSQMAWPTMH